MRPFIAFTVAIFLAGPAARAEDASSVPAAIVSIPPGPVSIDEASHQAFKAWTRSLAPLVASQALDAASSYGYRELNPMLADSNGNFGMRSTVIKFAVVGALIGVEYLLVRKSPQTGKLLAILNWSGAAVTTGFAVHNYSVR